MTDAGPATPNAAPDAAPGAGPASGPASGMAAGPAAGPPSGTAPARREDLLVSVCCADLPSSPAGFEALRALAARLDAAFRFWEIVLVVPDDAAEAYLGLVRDIAHLRLFKVRRSADLYRRRTIAADEAIGDVIVIAAAAEMVCLDILEIVRRVDAEKCLVMGRRGTATAVNRTLAPVLTVLGRGAGFRVNARDMMTVALPRALLNRLLSYPDRELALRFPPRSDMFPVHYVPGAGRGLERRSLRDLDRRLGLVQKLLAHFAPRLLFYVGLLSALVVGFAALYALYAVAVWLVRDSIAEGWLTLSLMISFTAMFMGFASLGLSLGLQQIMDKLTPKDFDDVVDEVNTVDLFGQVARDLNVEIDTGPGATPGATPDRGPDPGAGMGTAGAARGAG